MRALCWLGRGAWNLIHRCFAPLRTLGLWLVSASPSSIKAAQDPYAIRAPGAPKVTGRRGTAVRPDDADEDWGETAWLCVSRHGLMQGGICCPSCGSLVAQKGDFHAIQRTPLGEAVPCRACNALLLASPDDDIDPVTPKQSYDESIYHTFVRGDAVAVAPPVRKQRCLKRAPVVGDWVVIIAHEKTIVSQNAPAQDLYGSEGRVTDISGSDAAVALSGNSGIGGTGELGGTFVMMPLSAIAPMVLPTLRPSDSVRVLRGEYAGWRGVVRGFAQGTVQVDLMLNAIGGLVTPTVTVDLPIERLEAEAGDEREW